jgi:hypothetical protein
MVVSSALETSGYIVSGDRPLSCECTQHLDRLIRAYRKGELGSLNLECLEGEIDINVLLVNQKWVDASFAPFASDVWSDAWCAILSPLCRTRLWLAKIELHCHNLTTDGSVHRDEDRDKLRVWNVAIPLHRYPNSGTTVIYPDDADEDDLGASSPSPISCPMGGWYLFDANRLHFRRAAPTTRLAAHRATLMLTFTDGPPDPSTGFIAPA